MSARYLNHIYLFLVLGVALLLTACGTTTPKADEPDPVAPTIASVQPPAAAAGQTVVIAGAGFGESGAVSVGRVSAPTLSWSDERIEIAVPAGVDPAWQSLVVHVASAEEAQAELFLGSSFAGLGPELQAFLDAQATGLHVLLPTGTLDTGGAPLTLDGLHIYGSREGTQLELGGGDLQIVVGLAPATSLTDLTLTAATVGYLAAIPGTQPLDPSWVPTVVSLDRVDLKTGDFGDSYWQLPSPLPGVLTLNDSHLSADGDAVLMGLQGVNVSGSTIEGLEAAAGSFSGAVVIESSSLVGESIVKVIAALDVTVKSSTLRATDGRVHLFAGAGAGAVDMPLRLQTLHLSASVVEALDANVGSESDGNIQIGVQIGALELLDNETIHARNMIEVRTFYASSVTIQGNKAISAGKPAPDELDTPYPGVIILELQRLEGSGVDLSGNRFRARMLTVGDDTDTPWPDEIEAPAETTARSFRFSDNDVYAAAPSYAYVAIKSQSSGTSLCEVHANRFEVSSDEGYPAAYFECGAAAAGEFMVHDNDFLVTGPEAHMSFWYSARGVASEFTGNTVQVTERLGINSNGSLTIGNNDLVITNLSLRLTNVDGVTTVTNNSVVAPSVDDAILELSTSGSVAVTENQFLQEAPPSAGWMAIDVAANGATELTVSGNEFSNLGRAIRLYSDGHEFTGAITNNNFDFPITYLPAAAEVAALNGAAIDLDLRSNRWGQLQTPEEVADYVFAYADDTSTLELVFSTVLTE